MVSLVVMFFRLGFEILKELGPSSYYVIQLAVAGSWLFFFNN
jgi:hypothetical protein